MDVARYRIDDLRVTASMAEIVAAYESVRADDWAGEVAHAFLKFVDFDHARPYLKEDAKPQDWPYPASDDELQNDFRYYASWWREKIVNQRGISCWRGRDQFAARMMVAGCPEWREVMGLDGYYASAAYARACELFEDLEPLTPHELSALGEG